MLEKKWDIFKKYIWIIFVVNSEMLFIIILKLKDMTNYRLIQKFNVIHTEMNFYVDRYLSYCISYSLLQMGALQEKYQSHCC